MKKIAVLLSLLFSFALPARAQDFGYGSAVSGTLNDTTPRTVYTFDGLRGDVIAVDLTVSSGNLDPMLTLMDSHGGVIALRDDSSISGRGSRDLHIDSLHIPRSDRYELVVGRFGYALGTTSGQYTMSVDRIGVSSASGSALRYGDSVFNTITDMTPQVYYSFRARRGDVITVKMQRASGDLDAALEIVNSQSQVIASNDDSPGTLDAAINGFIIREDGAYVIIASRFGQAAGRSRGSFVLTLNVGAESGLGKSIDFALPMLSGIPVQGEITDDSSVQFYSFDGKRDDVVSIRMNRLGGALDAFLALLSPAQIEITNDDDSGGGQNALIDRFVLPVDGTYTIIATRFDRAQGTSVGAYQLQVDISGNVFQDVPTSIQRLEVGSTVTGAITADAPQVLYAFLGRQSDVLTIAMNQVDGDLDPRVAILNSSRSPITSDDNSGGGQNARIDSFVVPSTGVYYLLATHASRADTSGQYTLTLTAHGN
jgi:Bacterial pre-peptidase C-terminal domain